MSEVIYPEDIFRCDCGTYIIGYPPCYDCLVKEGIIKDRGKKE